MACGCSGALDLCITTLGNDGQNILIPRPGFGLYSCLSVPRGVEARQYNLLVRTWHIIILNAWVKNIPYLILDLYIHLSKLIVLYIVSMMLYDVNKK